MSGVARMTTRARALLVAEDALLVAAFALVVASGVSSAFSIAMSIAIVVVIAWSFATLHFPDRVAWTDEAITFGARGREHTFAWRDVTSVHVRRFIVRDRVLVRMVPAPPWRGRYWLLARMDGYAALVEELERRRACTPLADRSYARRADDEQK